MYQSSLGGGWVVETLKYQVENKRQCPFTFKNGEKKNPRHARQAGKYFTMTHVVYMTVLGRVV